MKQAGSDQPRRRTDPADWLLALERRAVDDLTARLGGKGGPQRGWRIERQEVNRAISERNVHAAGVFAPHVVVVATGSRSGIRRLGELRAYGTGMSAPSAR